MQRLSPPTRTHSCTHSQTVADTYMDTGYTDKHRLKIQIQIQIRSTQSENVNGDDDGDSDCDDEGEGDGNALQMFTYVRSNTNWLRMVTHNRHESRPIRMPLLRTNNSTHSKAFQCTRPAMCSSGRERDNATRQHLRPARTQANAACGSDGNGDALRAMLLVVVVRLIVVGVAVVPVSSLGSPAKQRRVAALEVLE